nr:hypothetical protein [Lachnospiraceae bacterium]
GAKVRVREPGGRKGFPKEPDPYTQLSFDPEPWTEPEPEPVAEAPKPESKQKPVAEAPKPESKQKPAAEAPKPEQKLETAVETPKPIDEAPKPEIKPEPALEAPKPVKKPQAVPKAKSGSDGTDRPEALFKQCERCWCFDCKHNSRGPAVPRDLCGKMMPCPACKGCESDGFATVCEIGNAKEGCMLRATEEGIYVPDEV